MNAKKFIRYCKNKLPFTAKGYPLRSTEQMTRIILFGSFAVNLLILLLLLFSWIALDHQYLVKRILVSLGVLVFLTIIAFFVYKQRPQLGAWLLVILYACVGMLILHAWGINAPIGILVLGFVIFLASATLGPKHIFFVTFGIIALLSILQYFNIVGMSQPYNTILDKDSTYGDVLGYSIIFIIFAVISWLSGTRMEMALQRAVNAEEALQKERDVLAKRVEAQTKRIIESQQKELKQLYKFAELGQLTTIILHELANYLSVLTLDIEDLKERHENSVAIKHAKESIFYIDTIIDQVRNQIKDSDDTKRFDALITTKDAIVQLRKRLPETHIKLFIEDTKQQKYYIYGDPLRLCQAITILVTNAAQANKHPHSEIFVDVSSNTSSIRISVKDFGAGIGEDARRSIFQPQKSKKGSGLGIGLYVTKQIIDTHFKGRIWLSPATEYTEFNIELPKVRTTHVRNSYVVPTSPP
ncbi:MAG: HAMP domain-containing histidine kinase [Candidatus Microsaccharimonas sossegonensis]|uniref:histidine kinase n=1 Tax=Candidatus Microsaccharimonas sossegonensis TaxID=2506948 RepID=A0A4Q0AI59_9BACT|nr:MAG: HAMP domain-containing histidine kinase [Candidatus Microsaccharimonas sossegonensis]